MTWGFKFKTYINNYAVNVNCILSQVLRVLVGSFGLLKRPACALVLSRDVQDMFFFFFPISLLACIQKVVNLLKFESCYFKRRVHYCKYVHNPHNARLLLYID